MRVQLRIHGMTCTDCEKHIRKALNSVGAENISASFRRGEATFEVDEQSGIESAKRAVAEIGYEPGDPEILIRSEGNYEPLTAGNYEYDLLIIGSGGSAFSAAIQAVSYGAKVGMIERGTIGGTCVNIGCVPSKTLLRAGDLNHLAGNNPFFGLNTSSGPVDLKLLVAQKNELVGDMRQQIC